MNKYLLILLIVILPFQINSQSINARFSTSFYSWERNLTASNSVNHFRIYQTAQLTIGQLASNKLSFHLYGQASQDIAESADDDPIPRLYNAYFRWNEKKGILKQVKLGRQRVYSGVAYGKIDGIDITFRVGKLLKFGGFAGFLVPFSNEIEINKWDANHTFGLRLSTNKILDSKILVSFMQRNRQPVPYPANGRYSPLREVNVNLESLEQRLIGIDIYRSFSRKLNIYGRFDYDIEQERVRRSQIEFKVRPTNKLELTGEFFHRAPFIEANSLFTIFEHNSTRDIGFRANYRLNQSWNINGNCGLLFYDGDESIRFGVGVRGKYGYFGYNFRRGYGGQNNGAYAALNYPLTSKLALTASTGLSRYSLYNEDGNENTSLTGSVGFNYRSGKHFSLDFLGQGVRNRYLSSEFRFFVKANYWFFNKSKK